MPLKRSFSHNVLSKKAPKNLPILGLLGPVLFEIMAIILCFYWNFCGFGIISFSSDVKKMVFSRNIETACPSGTAFDSPIVTKNI